MRRLAFILPLLLWVAACGTDPDDPALTPTVGEADVERFRAEVFLETLPLDADLAAFEDDIAALDSVTGLAYTDLLERLRDQRRRLQVRVDTLSPLPQALFDTTTAGIRGQLTRLRRLLDRAPLVGAPDVETLRAATQRVLGDVSSGADALRGIARDDTTGVLSAQLDSLNAQRIRVEAQFRSYPDTSDTEFPPFRQQVTRAALTLRAELNKLTPDSLKVNRDPLGRAPGSN